MISTLRSNPGAPASWLEPYSLLLFKFPPREVVTNKPEIVFARDNLCPVVEVELFTQTVHSFELGVGSVSDLVDLQSSLMLVG